MSVRPTTTTVTRLSSSQLRLNCQTVAMSNTAQAKINKPMQETTARKMFEARFSFDGCDIALSWRGSGPLIFANRVAGGRDSFVFAGAHSGAAHLGKGAAIGFTALVRLPSQRRATAAWPYTVLQQ